VFLLALLALSATGLAFVEVAFGDALSPQSAPTPNADDTDTLYKIVFVIGLAVVGAVWAMLLFSLVRFRARRGRVAPQIRGNTRLELIWTIGASVVVAAIAVVTLFFVDDIKNPSASGPAALAEVRGQNAALNQPAPPGGEALEIKVSGQQYLWRYQYPNGAVSFHDMVVPRDTTVTLEITSNDVAHSWWIPELGGKQDALRGLTNESWFKARETGTFRGQCAELCGANHTAMTARVIVVEPDRYEAWVENQKNLIDDARKEAQEQRERLSAAEEGTSSEQPATGDVKTEGSQERTGGGGG
jgi:cytochrome c oxidase subunit 2